VSLGLEEDLVPFRIRELHDFVFNGRAVSRAARRDCTTVHCGLPDVLFDDLLAFCLEVSDPARQLFRMSNDRAITSPGWPKMRPGVVELLDLAFLSFQLGEIN
jgi:hypothetical protein